MSIENSAIAYGDPRYGRSCANGVYSKSHVSFGFMCERFDSPTKRDKCCGHWGGEYGIHTHTEVILEENQGELF